MKLAPLTQEINLLIEHFACFVAVESSNIRNFACASNWIVLITHFTCASNWIALICEGFFPSALAFLNEWRARNRQEFPDQNP